MKAKPKKRKKVAPRPPSGRRAGPDVVEIGVGLFRPDEKVKLLCHVLCDVEGRTPDYKRWGEEHWRKHESVARMILNALAGGPR